MEINKPVLTEQLLIVHITTHVFENFRNFLGAAFIAVSRTAYDDTPSEQLISFIE